MSTLAEMRSNVREDMKIDPNGDIWGDSQIDRKINRFIGNVYSLMNLDFEEVTDTLSLVGGTATYDLDAGLDNYGVLESLTLTGRNTPLNKVELQDLQAMGFDLTTQGEPQYLYFYGNKTIGLYPVPDGVITTALARYQRDNPILTSGESPAFAQKWHYVCELFAIWELYATTPGMEAQASAAKKNFDDAYDVMRKNLWERDNGGTFMRNSTQPIRAGLGTPRYTIN